MRKTWGWNGRLLAVGAAGVMAGALALAAPALAYTVAPGVKVSSPSYVTLANGDLSWTVTVSGLTSGEMIEPGSGPTSSTISYLLSVPPAAPGDVSLKASGTSETLTFQSLPGNSSSNLYADAWFDLTLVNGGNTYQTAPIQLNIQAVGQLPEVPWAALLPVIGLGVVGALVWRRRNKPA